MQPLTPELEAILKSKLQAGDSGFRGRVVTGGETYFPSRIDLDHSLQTFASACTLEFTNEEGEVGLDADVFVVNALIEVWVWYGDEANEIQVFEGFIDKVSEHRDPRDITVKCRDWSKPLLVQDILVLNPQREDEENAVRTTDNFVYLNMEISDIVTDLLNKSGFPADQRAIQPSNFVVEEYLGRDGSSYADLIGELADIIAFNAFCDEIGVFHFQADGLVDSDTDNPPVPVYTFRTGEDIVVLDPTRDDYDTKTRVRAVGPFTSFKDAWVELWHTNVVKDPTGIMYDPDDPDHIYVGDGFTKKMYKISQTTLQIVSSTGVLVTTFLNGLSGDPDDDTVYWTFDAPWIVTGSPTNNKARKHLKSDNSVVATFNFPNKRFSDMKVGTDGIYVSAWDEDVIYLHSKTDGSLLDSWPVGDGPVGIAIDDAESKLFQLFTTSSTMYISTPQDLDAIVSTIVMSGSRVYGGDIDTTTHTEFYGVLGGLSLVAKFSLVEPVTTDVAVEVVNEELEAELGVEMDNGVQIRRLILRLDQITSYAQATEAATRWLDKLDQFRNVLDVGILGNPAIQKGDMVRIEDPVTNIANDFQVDTYRSALSGNGTYLGTMSLVPWTSSYSGPGDNFPLVVTPPELLWGRLYLRTEGTADVAQDASWDVDRREPTPTENLSLSKGSGVDASPDNWTGLPKNISGFQAKFVLPSGADFSNGSVRSQVFGKAKSGIGINAQWYQSQLVIRLFDSSDVLKGYLLADHSPGSLDSTPWSNEGTGGPSPPSRNTMFPADSQWADEYGAPLQNGLTGVAGDYILVEWGAHHVSGQDGPGAGWGMHFSSPSSQADLPANDQSQTTSGAAWIEFYGTPT